MHFEKEFSKTDVYFDMDGTLFDLYGVPDWLPMLRAENVHPYAAAKPLVDMDALRGLIAEKRDKGIRFHVISWTSKESSDEYRKAVRAEKRKALERTIGLALLNEVHIIRYGYPKHYVAETIGYLVDDDVRIREAWERRGGITVNPLQQDILAFVASL